MAIRLASVLWLGLLASPPPIPAEEPPPGRPTPSPADAYEKRLAESGSQIGMKWEGVAAFADSNGMRRTALDYWRFVLEFLPDHAKARRTLGFAREGAAWKQDEGRIAELGKIEDADRKKRPDLDRKVKEAQSSSSRILGEIGDLAEKAGLEPKAREFWKRALAMDSQNPGPNRKLGHVQEGGRWWSPRALAHREYDKRYDAALREAKESLFLVCEAEKNEDTGLLRGESARWRTNNYRIESNLPVREVKDALNALERCRAFYIAIFGIEEKLVEFESSPHVFVVVREKELHDFAIERSGLPEFHKKFSSVAADHKFAIVWVPEGRSLRDSIVHTAAHTLVESSLGGHAPWLREALANAVSAPWGSADLSVCFAGSGTTGGIDMDRIPLAEAPALLRDLALTGSDRPFGEFVGAPPEALRAADIAKSWSVVRFLLEKDARRAAEYFAAAGHGGGGGSKDGKALKAGFPDLAGWPALDAAWREWILEVF